jgi:TRAP-type uncharacterized transport system substrate-binding protein
MAFLSSDAVASSRCSSLFLSGTGFTALFSTGSAFAALDGEGRIHAWGNSGSGGTGAPSGTGFTALFSTYYAFAALDNQGAIHAWGGINGGSAANAYVAQFSAYALVRCSRLFKSSSRSTVQL